MRKKNTVITLSSLIIIVLFIGTAMIPVFAGSLSLSKTEKVEADSASGSETDSKVINEPEKVEPEPAVEESEPMVADGGCSSCGGSTQPTGTTGGSNPEEAVGQPQDPPGGEPCGCVEAVTYALNYAKEQEWENRPKYGDYVALYPLRPVKALFLWINGTRAWLGDLASAINVGFQHKDYIPGFNVVKAITEAFDFTVNEILELLNLIPFPTIEAIMALSELFLVFPVRALAYFIILCFSDDGGNNGEILETIQVSTMEIMETQSSQQTQNI